LEILRRLLHATAASQAVVLPLAAPTGERKQPRLLRDLATVVATPDAPAEFDAGSGGEQPATLRAALLALEPAQRRAKLAEALQQAVAQVLRMPPARVGLGVALGALGLDSLMAFELRNRLEGGLEIILPATFAWNYPTIQEMLPYLAARMELSLENTPPAAPAPVLLTAERNGAAEPNADRVGGLDQLLAGIQDLSDEGVLELLKTQSH
jgi:acyl carrier protein